MPYSLVVIKDMLKREYDITVTTPALKIALETPPWQPAVGRMIAVGNSAGTLDKSTAYGSFTSMKNGQYEIDGQRGKSLWKLARPLSAVELSNCY